MTDYRGIEYELGISFSKICLVFNCCLVRTVYHIMYGDMT